MATSTPPDRSTRRAAFRKKGMSERTVQLLAAYVVGALHGRQKESVRRYVQKSPEAQQVVQKLCKKLRQKKRSGVKAALKRACVLAAVFLLMCGAGAAWHFFSAGGERQIAALYADWTKSVTEGSPSPAEKSTNTEKAFSKTVATEKKPVATGQAMAARPPEKPAKEKRTGDRKEKPVEQMAAADKRVEKAKSPSKTSAETVEAREKASEKKAVAGAKVAAKQQEKLADAKANPAEKSKEMSAEKAAARDTDRPAEKKAEIPDKARPAEKNKDMAAEKAVAKSKDTANDKEKSKETAADEKEKPSEKDSKGRAGEKTAAKDAEKPGEKNVNREMMAEKPAVKERPTEKKVDLATYQEKVQPLLKEFCIDCHTGKKAKGGFRLDNLRPQFDSPSTAAAWTRVQERLAANTMPPKRSPKPKKDDVVTMTDWIVAEMKAAEAVRQSDGRVVLRRLNRTEYGNAIRDVLGIAGQYKGYLPEDPVEDGFDNVASALRLSTAHLRCYLEAADHALDEFFAFQQPATPFTKKRYSFIEAVKKQANPVELVRDDGIVLFNGHPGSFSPWGGVPGFDAPAPGNYKIRISAYAYQSQTPVVFALYANNDHALIGYYQVPPEKPTVVEIECSLNRHYNLHIVPYLFRYPVDGKKNKPADCKGRGLAIQWVDVEGPSYPAWPSTAYQEMFGKTDLKKVTAREVIPVAQRALRVLTKRAFHRPVTDAEVAPYVELVRASYRSAVAGQPKPAKPGNRPAAPSGVFEEALRSGMEAVLCSPEFLLFSEEPGKLTDYALASRLSYFLWKAPPDAELLALAARNELSAPETLHAQVERMLASPKSANFKEDFLNQWLELRKIGATSPDGNNYPQFDELLQRSMVQETRAFFEEILKDDLSVLNFIDSDFVMLNKPLADLYGIKGIEGLEIRKVPVPKGSHRGGVLTQASILKITANGTATSPVTRGVWVLKNLIGKPPSPPPPDVPAIEPDIRGAVSVRQQLAKHRNNPSCASCHKKIDPLGFALENFDVIGGWRDYYRTNSPQAKEFIEVTNQDGKVFKFKRGLRVTSMDQYEGKSFRTIEQFKKILLRDPDQIARCVAEKLTTYATGAPVSADEKAELEKIIEKVRDKNYGMRSMVHALVENKLFLNK